MKNLGVFIGGLILIVAEFFLGILQAYVVLDVSKLYDITYITQLGFLKIYGLIAIIGLIRMKFKPDPPKNSGDTEVKTTAAEKMKTAFGTTFGGALSILIVWGLMYITYYIIAGF